MHVKISILILAILLNAYFEVQNTFTSEKHYENPELARWFTILLVRKSPFAICAIGRESLHAGKADS